MKNDKDKEKQAKLQEIDKKLEARVEGFMGPPPENINTPDQSESKKPEKDKKSKKRPEPEVVEPTGPPTVADSQTPSEPESNAASATPP